MASERFKVLIKPEDIQPDEPPKPLTKQQKWDNFWYYHKKHVWIGALAVLVLGFMIIAPALQPKPDYVIGLISEADYSTTAITSLENGIATLGEDLNGDGRVLVRIEYFQLPLDITKAGDPYALQAVTMQLEQNFSAHTSMIFLVDDAKVRYGQYPMFAMNDGSAAENPDFSRMGYRWGDCPVASALDLGFIIDDAGNEYTDAYVQQTVQDLQLVLRIYEGTSLENDKKATEYYNASRALFEKLTDGAA